MKNTGCLSLWMRKIVILLAAVLFITFIYGSCAGGKSASRAALYSFEYDGETYRIRSISGENAALSINELIGKNFLATDFDQDGFLDEIALGKISLTDAQKIYTTALTMLTAQNKLRKTGPGIKAFQCASEEYNCEVKSFRPDNTEPFNQFKLTDNRQIVNPHIVLGFDRHADGTIDEVVNGTVSLNEVQKLYSDVLEKGIEGGALIRTGEKILVK